MSEKLDELRKLLDIVDALRGPAGCPWDRAQKLGDLSRYLLEEASEAADAIEDAGGRPTPAVMEELGDLLMNIFLAARIAEDEGSFSIAEVAGAIAEKLVRRHPHVFGCGDPGGIGPGGSAAGGASAAGARPVLTSVQEVLRTWDAIKAE